MGLLLGTRRALLASASGIVIPNNLLSYWRMQEPFHAWTGTSGEVVDSSGNGHHGTGVNYNGTQSPIAGLNGNAGSFGGNAPNQYVSVPVTPTITETTPFSVTAWIKPASIANMLVLDNGSATAGSFRYYLVVLSSGKADFAVVKNAGGSNDVVGGTVMTTGNWYFLAGTSDGTTGANGLKVYVNAGLDGQGARTFSSSTIGGQVAAIGSDYNHSDTQDFNGQIAYVRIYQNHQLTLAEIAAIYASQT